LFVIDLGKTDGVGLLLLTKLRRQHPVVPIVLLATTANLETAVEAVQLGATSYLAKPTTVEVIATAVGRAELIRRRTPDSLDESMRAHIRRVLADCGYNKSEAAKRLGIDRRSLQRKMSKLHL
jgi:two-component system response regulator RegA